MLRSIRSRLIASYLLVVLLAMGIAAGLAWAALDRAFLGMLRENLQVEACRLAEAIELVKTGDLTTLNNPQLNETQQQTIPGAYSPSANVQPGYHECIIDNEGTVISLGQSMGETDQAQKQIDEGCQSPAILSRSEIQSVLSGEAATAVRTYTWAPDQRVLYAACPVLLENGTVGGVYYIASPVPRLTLSLFPTYFGTQALSSILSAVILAGIAGVLLARTLTQPLQRLTQAASNITRGEIAAPIPPASTMELNRLGEAFNTMNTQLSHALDALAAQARQREVILHGIADAVIAANESGEIVLANPAASTLLESASSALQQVIQKTMDTGKAQITETTVRDQVFEILTAPLHAEDGRISGAVAVGHNITTYRQLVRLRTNFVSDVSHELRTPLTAIKGLIETLQDKAADDPSVHDRFLNTIASETDRLIRLTNDLLLLTRADTGRLVLDLAPTDLVAAARRAVSQLEERAREKRLEVDIEPSKLPAQAIADSDRIHQVLVNLLDNAIKFTPTEGDIRITFGGDDSQISCTIQDSGPGIPSEEMPMLFERFYRGDRARARSADESGTGLGLAIAKTIVDAHGGRIWIESQPGSGAACTFSLPRNINSAS